MNFANRLALLRPAGSLYPGSDGLLLDLDRQRRQRLSTPLAATALGQSTHAIG